MPNLSKIISCLLFALLIMPTASFGKKDDRLRALQDCSKQKACVVMSLNFGQNDRAKTLISQRKLDGEKTGFTDFELRVKGKIGAGPAKYRTILFSGYTDGIACTDFGQGNVAVAGFVGNDPLIYTNEGLLQIVDGSLQVGCTDCIKIIDRKLKTVLNSLPSPSWNLNLSRHSLNDIGFDNDQALYIHEGQSCVRIDKGKRFMAAPLETCRASKLKFKFNKSLPDFPKLKLTKPYFVIDTADKMLVLQYGACT